MSKLNNNIGIKARLIGELQSILKPYGIRKGTIVNAVEQSLQEIKRDGSNAGQWLLPLIFWKCFDSKGFLLIDTKTPAGNVIPLDVHASAYAVWREAQQKAAACGLDELDADNALARVVHGLADCRARGKCTQIKNLRSYLFTGYMKELTRIIEKIGIAPAPDIQKESDTDDGNFFDAIENSILYKKIVSGLSEKEEDAVKFRYVVGCSFEETAERMGLSNSAARQILSRARRKIRKTYGKERAAEYEKTKGNIRNLQNSQEEATNEK